MKKIAQLLRKTVIGPLGHQVGATVHIPTEYKDTVARLEQGLSQRAKVGRTIDEQLEPVRLLQAPAIATGFEQASFLVREMGLWHGDSDGIDVSGQGLPTDSGCSSSALSR